MSKIKREFAFTRPTNSGNVYYGFFPKTFKGAKGYFLRLNVNNVNGLVIYENDVVKEIIEGYENVQLFFLKREGEFK